MSALERAIADGVGVSAETIAAIARVELAQAIAERLLIGDSEAMGLRGWVDVPGQRIDTNLQAAGIPTPVQRARMAAMVLREGRRDP